MTWGRDKEKNWEGLNMWLSLVAGNRTTSITSNETSVIIAYFAYAEDWLYFLQVLTPSYNILDTG